MANAGSAIKQQSITMRLDMMVLFDGGSPAKRSPSYG
jgi:hypothetical protein